MKVALIGNSGHQGYVLTGTRCDAEARLVAVASTEDEEKPFEPDAVTDASGRAVPHYEDYRKLLDRERPDVVGVAPIYGRHAEIAIDCLARGVHVMCEKPVACSLEELAALKRAHTASGVHFAGMHAMRYQPNFRAGWEALKAGRIGRPVLIASQKSYAFRTDRPQFYKSRDLYGSTLCWVAIHAIDWTCWMMGGFRTVYATHTTLCNRGYEDCESAGVVAFELAAGGRGCINFDFLKAYSDPVPRDRCRIAGDTGVIEIREGKAFIATHGEAPQELELAPEESFFKAFLDEIRGTGKCLLSAQDTYEVTRLALLARESADCGILIRVGETAAV